MRSIVVVGSINADLVTRCERLPGPGETVHGTSFHIFHGGKGANQAVALARLEVPVQMIGLVGTDSFGSELRNAMSGYGVQVEAVGTHPGASGVAVIQVEQEGQNRITVVAGANAALDPKYLLQHRLLLRDAAMVLTQLETPMATVEALAQRTMEDGIPLMLDPAPAAPLQADLLRRVAWLTPNLSEAAMLLQVAEPKFSSAADAIAMAQALHRLGPQNILLKLGHFGLAAVTSDADPVYLPAFKVAVKDTTAAGDALNAGFAAGLARGLAVPQALRYGSAVAALSVTRAGAQPSMPTATEVDIFLKQGEPA